MATKPTPKQEVAAPKAAAVATATGSSLPSFMREHVGKGLENLSMSDYEMPRIKLLQGISPELTEFDGLKAGRFWHTLIEQQLGSEGFELDGEKVDGSEFKLRIVPLYIDKRYVLWRPRHDGGGILARADDGVHWNPGHGEFEVFVDKGKTKKVKWKLAPTVAASGLHQWGTYDPSDSKSPPAATCCYVIVAVLPDYPDIGPMAIMLQRSTIKVARKLMGKLRVSRAPSYGTVFVMSSVQDQNANGEKFYNYSFMMDGFVKDEEQFKQNLALHEQFKKSGVVVRDLETADEAGEVPDGGTEDGAEKPKY